MDHDLHHFQIKYHQSKRFLGFNFSLVRKINEMVNIALSGTYTWEWINSINYSDRIESECFTMIWKQWMKSHFVEMPLQIPIDFLFISFYFIFYIRERTQLTS